MDEMKARLYRNCTRAYYGHVESLVTRSQPFSWNILLDEMADLMHHPKGKAASREKIRGHLNRVWPDPNKSKTVNLEALTGVWRTDFLEAFSSVVGVPVSRLTHVNYDGEGKLDEATYSALYAQVSGKRLSRGQVKRLNSVLRRQAARAGLFDMILEICERLLDQLDGKMEQLPGAALIYDCIRGRKFADVWEAKSSKKKARTKSSIIYDKALDES